MIALHRLASGVRGGSRWALGVVVCCAMVPLRAAPGASDGPPGVGADAPWTAVEELNAGLPRLANPPDLETPQAAVENFIGSCRAGDYDRAARSLNLKAITPDRQPAVGRQLARQLIAVMDQQIWFNWDDVPDRPDGQPEDDSILKDQGSAPQGPQSNLLLYRLHIGDRDFEVRLERVRPAHGAPVWVFARQTVRHIPTLYARFHPGRLERSLPAFLREKKFAKVAIWQWAGFAVLLLAGALFGWVVQRGLKLGLWWWTDSPWSRALADAIRGPGALTIGLCTFYYLANHYLGLAGPIVGVLHPFYVAVICASLVWFLHRLIHMLSGRISQRYAGYNSDEGNILITRISIVRHLLIFLLMLGGVAYALSGFEVVRRFGTTILASAGIAGIVLGIAAQRVLGNLFAGLLLGALQPVKCGIL